MSLSQENLNKLCMTGLYKCEPVLEWLPSYKRDDPYWCKNWTFRVHEYKGKYYMSDTYWTTGDDHPIELTDEIFDRFKLIFDFNNVEKFNGSYNQWLTYPDDQKWNIPIDSGGRSSSRFFILKGAMPLKERIVARLNDEIEYLERELEYKKTKLRCVENDKVDLRFVL